MLSPLDIHCLLEYYAFPPEGDFSYDHPNAIERLVAYGMLQDRKDRSDIPTDSKARRLEVSDKGKAHVEHLCNLSFPVMKWVLPEGGAFPDD